MKNATSHELIEPLAAHFDETKNHVTKLEYIFSSIGEKIEAKKCEAVAGITEEALEIMEATVKVLAGDAGIILPIKFSSFV